MLVVAELAVALMLVTVAVLLTRSFASLTSRNPRFERDRVAVFTMFVPSTSYAPGGRAALADIFRRLEDEIKSIRIRWSNAGVRSGFAWRWAPRVSVSWLKWFAPALAWVRSA